MQAEITQKLNNLINQIKREKGKILSWQKFWAIHNKIFVLASIFAFAISGVFLVFAYHYNSEANLLSQNEITQASGMALK
jgi:hypothetical protein